VRGEKKEGNGNRGERRPRKFLNFHGRGEEKKKKQKTIKPWEKGGEKKTAKIPSSNLSCWKGREKKGAGPRQRGKREKKPLFLQGQKKGRARPTRHKKGRGKNKEAIQT